MMKCFPEPKCIVIDNEVNSTTEKIFIEMESIHPDCQEMKNMYDACFNKWFSEKFLNGIRKDDECAPLFKVYQQCVKKAIAEKDLDMKDIQQEILGTEKEDVKPSS